ncbi:MAG: tetratricopeptide repeat protein, partial [Gemmataceae bacterium]
RRDIERYQEGRSVSAKRDSMRELAWKLVKRNVAVSMVSAVAIVLLAVSWGRSTYLTYQEQKLRREKFVPVFVEAAHAAVQRQQFDQALVQISMAVEYDPEHAEARLLKGQLLIVKGDYVKARRELSRYRNLVPDDETVSQLIDICRSGQPGDAAIAAQLSDVLRKQKAIILAASMVDSRDKLMEIYKQNIDAAWPGLSANLKMDKDGTCTFRVPSPSQDPKRVIRNRITDLSPLRGIRLTELDLHGCDKITDLAPLQGMPLEALNLTDCSNVVDLTPLAGMPLRALRLGGCARVKDLTPLTGMPLTYLELYGLVLINDLSPLHEMPLTFLSLWRCGQIKDLSPLEGMPLRTLNLTSCPQIRSLAPLEGMKLTSLNLSSCYQFDERHLSVVAGMPLRSLQLSSMRYRDLSFLKGLPLVGLDLSQCPIADLSKLKGLKLEYLNLTSSGRVQDLSPLAGMPLKNLQLYNCRQVRELSPLKGTQLNTLNILGTNVSNISIVGDMPLEDLTFDPSIVKTGMNDLRRVKTLKWIGVTQDRRTYMHPQEFWTRYDAGTYSK